jgi:Stage II sporulation protein E (SpoIIE)
VLFTDGVTDQGPGQSPSRIEAIRRERAIASAEQLASAVERYALNRGGPQRDDKAILALRQTTRQPTADWRVGELRTQPPSRTRAEA